jgi:hypothetical protein
MTKPINTTPKGDRAWVRGPYKTTKGTDKTTGEKVTIIVAKSPKSKGK